MQTPPRKLVQKPCEGLQRPSQNAPVRPLPLLTSRISAGFPSPADDYVDQTLDLNSHLITHPAASFFIRVRGQSMLGAGIHDGDLLIVNRALEARDGRIVIAVLNGEFTVKRLQYRNGRAWLVAEHPNYPPLPIEAESECVIWGVVTHAIHSL